MLDTKTVLVVEDDVALLQFMCDVLEEAGYFFVKAENGNQALSILKREKVDLVLLDLSLGDINGFDILTFVRSQDTKLPILIVTTFTDIKTKLKGFQLGSDDYIVKPFYTEELLARVTRFLRRSSDTKNTIRTSMSESITCGPFEINLCEQKVFKNGKPIELRKRLVELLLFFSERPNQIFSKDQLYKTIWGDNEIPNWNSVMVHINALRNAIEDNPKKPKHLITVHGIGYKFVP